MKFECTKIKQDAFDEIKRIVARKTLSTYPDFNKMFKIHTNDSAFQLGVVIIQEGGLSFLALFWSGLQGPKAYSLWGGVVPSPSIGYEYL